MLDYTKIPRFPELGVIDITYRCNNNCRHCWLAIPSSSKNLKQKELTFNEINRLLEAARRLGCRKWLISGGEPMIRSDFYEIINLIASKSVSYSLNSNGTFITPKIAQLLKRNNNGETGISIYGANAEIHDYITRNPGSFSEAIRGIKYLKEVGVKFTILILPMRSNYHQLSSMIKIAESKNIPWRIGAYWLRLSAWGDKNKNKTIRTERLPPNIINELNTPFTSYDETELTLKKKPNYLLNMNKKQIFKTCISKTNEFYIDPYGYMTACSFMRDPILKYNLRKGNFKEFWEEFLPDISNKMIINERDIDDTCMKCSYSCECQCCPVYSYLEHGRYSDRVKYLCAISRERASYKINWIKSHRRYYQIANITFQIDLDIPLKQDAIFKKNNLSNKVKDPTDDIIYIRYKSLKKEIHRIQLGKQLFLSIPWIVFQNDDSWIYAKILKKDQKILKHQIGVFNNKFSEVTIYNHYMEKFSNCESDESKFSISEILLYNILSQREGCYFKGSCVIYNGKGFAFLGKPKYVSSTMQKLLPENNEIIHGDGVAIRKHGDIFYLYSNWKNKNRDYKTNTEVQLKGIFFLKHAHKTTMISLENKEKILFELLCVAPKPFLFNIYKEYNLKILNAIANFIPSFKFQFNEKDKSSLLENNLKKYNLHEDKMDI